MFRLTVEVCLYPERKSDDPGDLVAERVAVLDLGDRDVVVGREGQPAGRALTLAQPDRLREDVAPRAGALLGDRHRDGAVIGGQRPGIPADAGLATGRAGRELPDTDLGLHAEPELLGLDVGDPDREVLERLGLAEGQQGL